MLNWNVLPRTYAFLLKCAREVFPVRKINLFPLLWVSLFCLDVTRELDPSFCAILETDFNVLGNEWCRNCGPKFIHLDIYNLLLFMIWIWKWFELDLVMLLLNSWLQFWILLCSSFIMQKQTSNRQNMTHLWLIVIAKEND